jgi:hypothetical protein
MPPPMMTIFRVLLSRLSIQDARAQPLLLSFHKADLTTSMRGVILPAANQCVRPSIGARFAPAGGIDQTLW